MRETLFRGKRIDNGEWVEGFYVKCRGHHYMLNSILSDGLCVKLNLAIIDCNQYQWQGLRRHKCPIDIDFVYDQGS